jgi:hypothetical protein
MSSVQVPAPFVSYTNWLRDRNALDLELMRETTQVRSRATLLEMSETFEKSLEQRLPRQVQMEQDQAGSGFPQPAWAQPDLQLSTTDDGLVRFETIGDQHCLSSATFIPVIYRPCFESEQIGEKCLSAVAIASIRREWRGCGCGLSGFISRFEFPARAARLPVVLNSRLQCNLNWAEANALLPGSSAAVRVTAHLVISDSHQVRRAAQRLAAFQANEEKVLTLDNLPTDSPLAEFSLPLVLDAKRTTLVEVFEFIELVALEQNAHANISGSFSWAPLRLGYSLECQSSNSQKNRLKDGI